MNRRIKSLSRYRDTISRSLAEKGRPEVTKFKISLAEVIPGIMFRELSPLAVPDSPLRPYVRDKVSNQDYVPRKTQKLVSQWLVRTLTNYDQEEYPESLNIIYIGDSATDFLLAKNLSAFNDARTGVRVNVSLYLFDPLNVGEERISSELKVLRFVSWSDLEIACVKHLANTSNERDNFLFLDVDRTVLLPRGICDTTFSELAPTATCRFVAPFIDFQQPSDSEIIAAFRAAKHFPPYEKETIEGENPYKSDEDVRAIGSLFLLSNLLDVDDFSSPKTNLLDWMPGSLDRIRNSPWNNPRFQQFVEELKLSIRFKDCTLATYFREMEHQVMLEMADKGICLLNGHIIRLLVTALENQWTPVAYSDRPSVSVGLAIRSYSWSRPTIPQRSIIHTQLPVVFDHSSHPSLAG